MTLRSRLAALLLVTVLFLAVYAIGKHYSPLLVYYVVTESLIEKAPAGTDPAALRRRMAFLRPGAGERGDALAKLLAISRRLEKTQRLGPGEIEEMLGEETDRKQ